MDTQRPGAPRGGDAGWRRNPVTKASSVQQFTNPRSEFARGPSTNGKGPATESPTTSPRALATDEVVELGDRTAVLMRRTVELVTERRFHVVDVTDDCLALLGASGVREGTLTVYSQHTTCAVKINERETCFLEDLRLFMESLVPADAYYRHDDFEIRVRLRRLAERQVPRDLASRRGQGPGRRAKGGFHLALEPPEVVALSSLAGTDGGHRGVMEQARLAGPELALVAEPGGDPQVAGRRVEEERRAREHPEVAGPLAARDQAARLEQVGELVRDGEAVEPSRPHPDPRIVGIERSPAEHAGLAHETHAHSDAIQLGKEGAHELEPLANALAVG